MLLSKIVEQRNDGEEKKGSESKVKKKNLVYVKM